MLRPAALGDRIDMVFKGTAVAQGTGRAVVTATGMDTQVGEVAALLEATAPEPTPLEKEVARIGRTLGLAVVVIAIVVVSTILLISEIRNSADVVHVLLLGVSLAVAAVPEGLPAILAVVLALGVQRMAKHRAIVKNLSAVETLGSASVICSDKTGTLTRSEMTIERVVTASGDTRVSGVGYAPEGRVHQIENPDVELAPGPLRDETIVVLSGGSLAGNAALRKTEGGEWEIHGDPTEAAFLVAERKLGVAERRERRFERIAEIPFTSERKLMTTIERDHEHGDAFVAITKGAPDVLLGRCTQARVGMEIVSLDDALRARLLADVDMLSDAALRTLAVAYRPLAPDEDPTAAEGLERDLIFVGTVGMIDPPRKEAAVAIREARRAGIRVVMITGDHPKTAARIAADLGIVDAGAPALTGAEIDALDEAAFAEAVRKTSVYARVAPAHKLRIVDALQADGNIVAMTGDGVNDAPALKAADIGIAMGVTGTEVTKEAAKMILADDNFSTIVQAVREGRAILDNIRKFLRYLLSSNMGEVLTVFLGVVGSGVIGLKSTDAADFGSTGGAVVLPLLATQLLWITPYHGLRPRTRDGRGPTHRRPDGPQAAACECSAARRPHVGQRVPDRWGDRAGELAHNGLLPTWRVDRWNRRSDHGPHRGFHGARVHEPVHLLHRALGHHECFRQSVRQPLALECHRTLAAAAGGRRPRPVPEHCLRHGTAGAGPVAGVRGNGQRGVDLQRTTKTAEARLESCLRGLVLPAVRLFDRVKVHERDVLASASGPGCVSVPQVTPSICTCNHHSISARCHSLLPWMRVKCASGLASSLST